MDEDILQRRKEGVENYMIFDTKDLGQDEEVLEEGVTEEINTTATPSDQEIDTSSLQSKSSLIQDLGLERFSEMKGRITTGKSLTDFPGITAHLTFSDRLATGKVGERNDR